MRQRHRWLAFGLTAASAAGAALVFTACSSNSSGPGTTPSDATTSDQSAADSAATPDTSVQETGTPDGAAPHEASTSDASDAGGSCSPYDASGLDEASVAAGFAAVWQVYRCWGCHQNPTQLVGDAGGGIVLSGNDAGLGDSGLTWPPNLTGDPETGLGCWTNQQIQNAIVNGQDQEGGALCPTMPVWGHALMTTDGGIRPGTPMDAGTAKEIIDFLRSLPPVVNHLPDTTCPMPEGGPTDAAAGTDAEGGSDAGSSADAEGGTDAGSSADAEGGTDAGPG